MRKRRTDVDDDDAEILSKRMSALEAEFAAKEKQNQERWEHILSITEANTLATEANTQAVTNIADSTKGLLTAWDSITGAVRVGVVLGNFVKWAMGLSVVGGLFAYFFDLSS